MMVGILALFNSSNTVAGYEYPLIYPIDDAPVYNNPTTDMNNGSDGVTFTGLNGGYMYMKFSEVDLPDNSSGEKFSKAELVFVRSNGDQDFVVNLSLYTITSEWQEESITWANKPAQGDYVGSVISTQNIGEYRIDITNYLSSSGNTSFVLIPNVTDGSAYVKIPTKENTEIGSQAAPRIAITYDTSSVLTVSVDKDSYTEGPIKISWTSDVPLAPLTMELTTDSDVLISTIATNLDDSMVNFTWDPTNNAVKNYTWSSLAGKSYKIKIHNADNSTTALSGVFKLSSDSAPAIPGYSFGILALCAVTMIVVIKKKIRIN